MSVSPPLVSVVIATYNDAAWLPETLECALAQTYPRVEIIVVDDGSTDDTLRRIELYMSRIRYLRRDHEGLGGARNAGIALATGDFVALLDADDLWHPDKLAIQVAVAQRYPESGLIACDGVAFAADEPHAGPLLGWDLRRLLFATARQEVTGRFHNEMLNANPITCPAQVLIPRHVLREIGPFIDSKAQDYDCYLRIAQQFPVTVHRDALVRYRERPDSMSGPRGERRLAVGWDLLRVLRGHAARCDVAARRRIAARCRDHVRVMAYHAYASAQRGGRLEASRLLLRLVREGGFTAALPYLVALWTPERMWRCGTRGVRALRQHARRKAAPLANEAAPHPVVGRVERLAPELDEIVPPDARIEQVAAGFGFADSPVWIPEGYLLFADLPANVMRRWDPAGGASVACRPTGYVASNGMTLDADGRRTVCEPGDRRIARQEADGSLTVLADRFEGQRLNGPDDLVFTADGALYFTDPPHGFALEDADPAKELSFNGVFRLADGKLTLVLDGLSRPNGLAFSPDEKHLYVSNSDPKRKIWMRYDVEPDGSLGNGMLFLDLTGEPGQPPDGLKVDREGNLYLTGPGGLWIADPRGRVLGVIRTPHEPANAAWGDADGRTLYLTARGALYRIRLNIEGIRPPTKP